MVPNIFYYPAR